MPGEPSVTGEQANQLKNKTPGWPSACYYLSACLICLFYLTASVCNLVQKNIHGLSLSSLAGCGLRCCGFPTAHFYSGPLQVSAGTRACNLSEQSPTSYRLPPTRSIHLLFFPISGQASVSGKVYVNKKRSLRQVKRSRDAAFDPPPLHTNPAARLLKWVLN